MLTITIIQIVKLDKPINTNPHCTAIHVHFGVNRLGPKTLRNDIMSIFVFDFLHFHIFAFIFLGNRTGISDIDDQKQKSQGEKFGHSDSFSLVNNHKFYKTLKFYKKIRDVKGQLISKCPFGIFVWTKLPTKVFLDFCPEFFL